MWLVFNASGASVNTAAQEHRGQSGLESTPDLLCLIRVCLTTLADKYLMQMTNTQPQHCKQAQPLEMLQQFSRILRWRGFGWAPDAAVLWFCWNKTQLDARNYTLDAFQSNIFQPRLQGVDGVWNRKRLLKCSIIHPVSHCEGIHMGLIKQEVTVVCEDPCIRTCLMTGSWFSL